jgi:hypothetical protein
MAVLGAIYHCFILAHASVGNPPNKEHNLAFLQQRFAIRQSKNVSLAVIFKTIFHKI